MENYVEKLNQYLEIKLNFALKTVIDKAYFDKRVIVVITKGTVLFGLRS